MINQISQVTKFVSLKSFSRFWIPVLFFVTTGGLLVTLIFIMLGYQVFYLNRSYPGVLMAGAEVGGMTRAEIINVVKANAATNLDQPITIQVGAEAWTFTSQQLGLEVDVTATANKAYQVGRSGNLFADMLTHLSLIASPRYVEPVVRYERGATDVILQQLSGAVNYPPENGQVIVRSAAEIEVIPSQRGRRLHPEATQPLIEGAIFSDGAHPVVTAFTQEIIPTITNEDIAAISQQVQSLLTNPLVFGFRTTTDAAEWRLEPDSLAAMIDVVEKPDPTGRPQLTIELDRERLAPYLEEFARVINQEPVDARLKFDTELGQLAVVQYSRDGRTLDMEAAYNQASVSIATGSNFVELPVSLRRPAVSSDDIASLGIKELVSESTSYFAGSSQGRMHNIALAASKFDGVIVSPGEIFSFNQHLGAVTSEEGYDESLIIFGDRTTVGIGGGVCQVSTTAFRTAFFGGFELVERWAHGYRVGWYETNSIVGLDATIYTPDLDFKFRNDSDHHLLIHTHTDLEAGTLTFKFYGTPTSREVIVSEPIQTNLVKHGLPIYEETPTLPKGKIKQIDWAKDGLDVTVIRVVKDGDSIIHEDEIISHYNPWRAVFQVGTGS